MNLTILPTLKAVSHEEYAHAIAESGVKLVETARGAARCWTRATWRPASGPPEWWRA